MMTPREIVVATLTFQRPERLARNFTSTGEDDTCWGAYDRPHWPGDVWAKPEAAPDLIKKYPALARFSGEVRLDEYGSLWGRLPGDFGCGEVLYGAIEDWDALKDFQMPHLSDPARFRGTRASFEKYPDRFRMAGLPGFPFAVMRYIRKMEYFFEDLLLEPEKVMTLNALVTDELLGMVDRYAEAGAEAIFTCEDWGTQDRLLISPTMWRALFKPTMQRIFDRIHEHGMYVIMHSCGYIWEILGDLVEMGVDCMQFDAPTLMGMERVCELFDKKVTLFSPVDIQKVLPLGDPERVRAECRRMVDLFAPKGGGLIVKDYGDYKTLRIPQSCVDAMHGEFDAYGADLTRYYK